MRKLSKVAVLVSTVLWGGSSVLAQDTSSNIRGQVVNASGDALSNITVDIIHQPTGTKKTVTTSDSGVFIARGLTVGGPYLVKLQDGSQLVAESIDDLHLQLGKTASISLVARTSDDIETITVSGSLGMTAAYKKGASSEFSEDAIQRTPAISRDLKSVLQSDSKIALDFSDDGGSTLSVAGSNVRSNSLTVDGVRQNDDFGLNKNGYPGRRSPISLDAIEQLSVNIAPFDVTYGSFQGSNVNVVTKSGTNEFHGSAFYYRSDDSFIGDESDGEEVDVGEFTEDTYGFSLGGPILQDKLFFFTSYEKYETTSPYGFNLATDSSGVTAADYAEISEIAQRVYNHNIGVFDVENEEEDEKLLVKLDWFINDDHRASFTYQDNEGNSVRDFWSNPALQRYSSASNRYNMNEELTVYSLQVFSDWTDDFSTEFKLGRKEVTTAQDPLLGNNFAQMLIHTEDGGDLYIGPDQFRHANELENDLTMIKLKADYYLNDEHFLTFGLEHDQLEIYNLFVFASKGAAEYNSIADFEAQQPFTFFYQNGDDNLPTNALDEFEYTTTTLYVQDEWSITYDLTLTYGLRYTKYSNDDAVTTNTNFSDRHPGLTNTFNIDGLDLWEPRVGFNWTMDDQTVIRGGVGLFGGGAPNVWISNSYGNDGVRKTGIFCAPFIGDICGGPNGVADFAVLTGFDGVNIPTEIQALVGGANGDTNSIDPDFNVPSNWKFNLALERQQDLGILGDGWLLGLEAIFTKVKDAATYRELNLEQIGTAPDGRPIYDEVAPFDLQLTNTDKGEGQVWTVSAANRFEGDFGQIDISLGYTYQDIKEVNPGNAFVAFEGYAQPANFDYQADNLFASEFEVPHRFTAVLSWSKEIFGDNKTSISVLYTGRSGQHFSYTMATNGAFGGFSASGFADWDEFNSQLLYVPTGTDDPLVAYADATDGSGTTAAQQAAMLDAFISSDDCLNDARGGIINRHACDSGFYHRFDVRFMQEIKISGDHKIELYLDIENFGNLLNNDWGRIEQYNYFFVAPLVDASIVDGQYQYTNFDVPEKTLLEVPSLWKAQLGIRYKF